MGLRCSLFGHDYGEPFVERDREERGNEVVVTERELTECARCGAEKVTSQNTEVRSLETDRDAGRTAPDLSAVEQADAASDGTPGTAAESATNTTADVTADASPEPSTEPSAGSAAGERSNATPAAESDDSAGGAFTSASDAIEQAEAGTSQPSTEEPEAAPEPTEPNDDAVIMSDETDDGPGSKQWGEHSEPDPEQTPPSEPEPDDDEQEDVEFIGSSAETTEGAQQPADDAAGEFGESASTETTGVQAESQTRPETGQPPEASASTETPSASETGSSSSQSGGQANSAAGARSGGQSERGRGEWPEPDDEDEGFDATAGTGTEDASFQFGEDAEQEVVEPTEETGFTSVGSVDQSGPESLDYAIYCPECGLERAASGSSLRAGDICPECQRGYLAEDR